MVKVKALRAQARAKEARKMKEAVKEDKKLMKDVNIKIDKDLRKRRRPQTAAPKEGIPMNEKVTRPKVRGGILQQPHTLQPVLSGWDEMLVSKYCPGRFNAPYVAGMNATNLPTSTFSVSHSLASSSVLNGGGTSAPFGGATYTLLMWCPSMTAFYGDGATVSSPAVPVHLGTTTKLGGMVAFQVNANDSGTPFLNRGCFQQIFQARSMVETYSSDMTGFSSGGFVWAAELSGNMLCPRANLVGSYFQGTLAFGQLPAELSLSTNSGLSINQLIEIAGAARVGSMKFKMKSAVVNHEIVYDSQQTKGEGYKDSQMVAELANYIIFQNPAQSISAPQGAFDWSLQFNIKGNTVFWPQPKDSIANNLWKDNQSITDPLPSYLSGIQQNPEQELGYVKTVYDGAKSLAKKVISNPVTRRVAESAAGKAMNLMGGHMLGPGNQRMIEVRSELLEEDTLAPGESVVIKADYMMALERVFDAINDIGAQNPQFDTSQDLKRFAREMQRVEKWRDRLVPATDPPDSDTDSTEQTITTDKIPGGTSKKTRSK